MELIKVVHFDTDGYTYGCETTVGIYTTFEKAEAAVVRYIGSMIGKPSYVQEGYRYILDKNTYVEVETFTVDEDWS